MLNHPFQIELSEKEKVYETIPSVYVQTTIKLYDKSNWFYYYKNILLLFLINCDLSKGNVRGTSKRRNNSHSQINGQSKLKT